MATPASVYTERADQLQDQRWKDQRDVQLTPLQESLRADQTRLALYANPDDPTKPLPGKEDEYNAIHNRMAQTIGQMRQLYGQKPQGANPVEAGVGNLLDKLHITNHLKNHVAEVRAANAARYQGQTQQMAGEYAAGAYQPNPYTQSEAQMRAAGFSEADIQQAMRTKAGLLPKDTTEQERFVTNYKTQHPGSTDEQALKAYTDATAKPSTKTPEGIKVIGTEALPIGLRNGDTGQQYLPSQLGPDGTAPPEYKEAWAALKKAQADKQAQVDKRQQDSDERQIRSQENIAARMGQQEQFQVAMTAYRSDMGTYKTLNTLADTSQETVDSLKYLYSQPGNKAVADNMLQNMYTTVVQKGGRKTAAELALTTKIGSFGLNIQTIAQKAASGELPEPLRKALLSGMESIAAEQRKTADAAKPELPEITAPEGRKTRKLKDTKSSSAVDNFLKNFPSQ